MNLIQTHNIKRFKKLISLEIVGISSYESFNTWTSQGSGKSWLAKRLVCKIENCAQF